MVVVSIIGILAGLSYLGANFIRDQRLTSASRRVLGDIQQARVSALISGSTSTVIGYGIVFQPPRSYVSFAFQDANMDFSYQTGEESGPITPVTYTLSPSVTLSLPTTSNYPVLIYSRQGYPTVYDGGGNSPSPSPQEIDIVLTDVSINKARCIQVTINYVREGVWSGATCSVQ